MGILDGIIGGRKNLTTPTEKEKRLSLKDSLNEVKKTEIPTTRKVRMKAMVRNSCGCGGTDWNYYDFEDEVPMDSPYEDGMTVNEEQIKVNNNGKIKLR